MSTQKLLHMVAFTLLLVGGLNWGLVGLFNYNLVEMFLGSYPMALSTVYTLVGVSTVYVLLTHAKDCKICGGKK